MKHFIFIAIILLITLISICAVFYFLYPSLGAFTGAIIIALTGGLTAVFEYETYKLNKKPTKWHE